MATSPSLDTRTYDGGLTRSQVVAWRNAVFVVFALSGLGISTWLGRVPSVRDILHASTLEMGYLAGGISVGSIIGVTTSSHLVARFGARRTVELAMCVVGLGMIGGGLAASLGGGFWGIIGFMAVFGYGNGTCDVAMNVSAAANERVLGRTIMPMFHASFSVGTMLGAALGAGAEAVGIPVGIHVPIVGAVIVVGTLLSARNFQSEELGHAPLEGDDVAAVSSWRSRLAVWAMPSTILIGLIVLGMAAAEGSANDWLALAMVDGYKVDNAAGTTIFFVFVTAITLARVAGSPLVDRFGRVPMLRASAVSAVVGLLLVIFSPALPLAIVGVVLWGFGAALGFPLGLSAAADDSRNAAARVGAVATIGYVAFLALPPLIGFLGEHFGLLRALLSVLVLIVVAGFASGAARERSRSRS
ncbi:MFS transporter [Frondihabitans australicus]|uniref:Fucose permease n=1 Tax=Frondihabitans australicus TaxID=386892 RepID=A0A495IJ07_9MICO|nr:MFS transporter [Frondihabitans australicus]RKR75749.1 fucose permease [Frondihabitans australicus]